MTESAVKRQNFNVTPEEEAELARLRETLGAPSIKDAILRAARTLLVLSHEVKEGRRIYSVDEAGEKTRLLLPDIESGVSGGWRYLVERPHSWRRQLYVKGRRLTASTVWTDMIANDETEAEAADDWDLPLEAVQEIVRYCESNRDLIAAEAMEENTLLEAAGVTLRPPGAARP
jgi:uncharacterized protein (DUF433 family)